MATKQNLPRKHRCRLWWWSQSCEDEGGFHCDAVVAAATGKMGSKVHAASHKHQKPSHSLVGKALVHLGLVAGVPRFKPGPSLGGFPAAPYTAGSGRFCSAAIESTIGQAALRLIFI
jgi:hypothetical protein